jgi:peptidyl-prolyl cis-trans isomerase B (cyclophilin B)
MRVALALLVLILALAGCGGGDDETNGGDTTSTTAGVTECQDVEAPEARDPGSNDLPAETLDESLTHTLTFDTSCGTFVVTLDPESARETTASLYALAEAGYFDDTIFHRVVPGFVIQGGDPTQTGGGGPGYSTIDTPPADAAAYTKGIVAMAKSGAETPGTGGSQFFVVTSDSAAGVLTPDYAIVGEVTEGIDTVERIDALGVGDGPPSKPVVVNTVTAASS